MTERTYDIGYFSSADRGLDVLISLIPKIEEKLGRKVTSVWAYGWDAYDQAHGKNPQKMKWKWQIIRGMSEVGMVDKHRLSHKDVAKLMQDTKVWAYPTSFPEIFCITAIKAHAAKMKIVTSGYGALQETVLIDEPNIESIHTKPEELDKFVDRVVAALKEPRDEKALTNMAKTVKAEYDWANIAKQWSEVLS